MAAKKKSDLKHKFQILSIDSNSNYEERVLLSKNTREEAVEYLENKGPSDRMSPVTYTIREVWTNERELVLINERTPHAC